MKWFKNSGIFAKNIYPLIQESPYFTCFIPFLTWFLWKLIDFKLQYWPIYEFNKCMKNYVKNESI